MRKGKPLKVFPFSKSSMYLTDKSLLEIFNLYCDNEIGRLIVNSTQHYAPQKFD